MFNNPGQPIEKPPDQLSKELLGKYKYIPFPKPLTKPEPEFVPHCWFPKNLLEITTAIASQDCPKFLNPAFKFVLIKEAALENWTILQKYNNLGEANSGLAENLFKLQKPTAKSCLSFCIESSHITTSQIGEKEKGVTLFSRVFHENYGKLTLNELLVKN